MSLGVGAMLHMLSGGSNPNSGSYIGKRIISADINDEMLRLGFDDGKAIIIHDAGQSCCESRYMRTDDDIKSLVGGLLTRIDAKPAEDEETDYGVHEIVFVEIGTDTTFITPSNHNEHNGYYGGFGLTVTEEGGVR